MQITNSKLARIVQKYATHPEFLGIDILDINQPGAVDDTILHLAIVEGSIEEVNTLLRCGADVNAVGDLGNTPLHIAALMNELICAEILLEHGANLKMSNEFAETAMDIAKIMDCTGIVSLFRKQEAHLLSASTDSIDVPDVEESIRANALARERWTEYRDLKKSS